MSNCPIILTAFGTSTKAKVVYKQIQDAAQLQFPKHQFFCTYSSKRVSKISNEPTLHPLTLLKDLYTQGVNSAVLQSLHLTPATDFHNLIKDLQQSPIPVKIGRPLLNDEEDFFAVSEIITNSVQIDSKTAVLVLGHGTKHPAWTFFPALHSYLQRKMGNNVFVGVVEHLPTSDTIPQQIVSGGFSKVLVVPFFLNLGIHFTRDISCNNEDCWQIKLEKAGLEVEIIGKSLGSYPEIQHLFCNHIRFALAS